jgi:hypothetical protein
MNISSEMLHSLLPLFMVTVLSYGLGALTKPLSGIVLTTRLLDKVGKGIRGAAPPINSLIWSATW